MKLASTPEEAAEMRAALMDFLRALLAARREETDPAELESMALVEAEARRALEEPE